jgi:hypothetical protein
MECDGAEVQAVARARLLDPTLTGTVRWCVVRYTLRNIPKDVDEILRRKAKMEGRTLNDVVIEALTIALGLKKVGRRVKRRDLSDIAGTWVEDPEFDAIMREQDQIDPEMWR